MKAIDQADPTIVGRPATALLYGDLTMTKARIAQLAGIAATVPVLFFASTGGASAVPAKSVPMPTVASPVSPTKTQRPPKFLGHPKQWGMVAIKINRHSSTVKPMDVVNVGGGTWSYGSTMADWGGQKCYSNYENDDANHSSTAILSGGTDTEYADSGFWSDASVTAGWIYTCYAYWAKY